MASEERRRVTIDPGKRNLTEEQRAGFVLVLITGTISLVLGFLFVARSLNRPFDIDYEGPLVLTSADERALEVSKMRNMDTDGDGLTDYEEVFEYNTGRYLLDTDGDGVSDGDEVKQGTDPVSSNLSVNDNTASTGDVLTEQLNNALGASIFAPVGGVDALDGSSVDDGFDLDSVTPEQIRDALRQNGVAESQIQLFSDQQLLERYYQVLDDYRKEQEAEDDSLEGNINAAQADLEQQISNIEELQNQSQ